MSEKNTPVIGSLYRAEQMCAVLDINYLSFDNFSEIVEKIGEKKLPTTLAAMKIIYDEKERKLIEFWIAD